MKNRKRIPYLYKVDNIVLVKNQKSTEFGKNAYNGPRTVKEVCNNGNIKIKKGAISDI